MKIPDNYFNKGVDMCIFVVYNSFISNELRYPANFDTDQHSINQHKGNTMFTHKKIGGIHFVTLFGFGCSFYRKAKPARVVVAQRGQVQYCLDVPVRRNRPAVAYRQELA